MGGEKQLVGYGRSERDLSKQLRGRSTENTRCSKRYEHGCRRWFGNTHCGRYSRGLPTAPAMGKQWTRLVHTVHTHTTHSILLEGIDGQARLEVVRHPSWTAALFASHRENTTLELSLLIWLVQITHHDVDFSGRGPLAVGVLLGEEPNCRPQPVLIFRKCRNREGSKEAEHFMLNIRKRGSGKMKD